MQPRRQAPTQQRRTEPDSRPAPIENPAGAHQSDSVGHLKPERDIRVVGIAPMEDLLRLPKPLLHPNLFG